MNILNKLIGVVAPHNCVACDAEGSLLCSGCIVYLGQIPPSRCFRCNKLTTNNATCTSCRRSSKLTHVWVRSEYSDIPKELVHRLKFERSIAAADTIALAMAPTLPDNLHESILVPIPTATSRMRQRGYDQSVLITKKIAQLTGMPMHQYLVRIGQTRQVGSKKEDRIRQLDGAYVVTNPIRVRGKQIILVDDVLTTGSTLEAAAKVLRKAGAKQVDALVFARA